MKEQTIECERKLLEAIKNSDVTILDELLHDNLLFNLPNGQTVTKEIDLETYRSGKMQIESITSSKEIINAFQDVAVVSVEIELKGKYDIHSLDGKFKYLRVWKMSDGNCKIIAGSCTQL